MSCSTRKTEGCTKNVGNVYSASRGSKRKRCEPSEKQRNYLPPKIGLHFVTAIRPRGGRVEFRLNRFDGRESGGLGIGQRSGRLLYLGQADHK